VVRHAFGCEPEPPPQASTTIGSRTGAVVDGTSIPSRIAETVAVVASQVSVRL